MKQTIKLAKSSKSDEHLTPDSIINFARIAMDCDHFDCDPATQENNPTNALTYYTKQDSGLLHNWYGNVWINPPFSLNKEFSRKTVTSKTYKQLIYLAKADFRTKWSVNLMDNCDHMVIINDYVKFRGSSCSALFSVVLYCFNVDYTNLYHASRLFPKFKIMLPLR